MKNNVVKKVEGYMPYNRCMPTSIEAFFSGSYDTFKKGMPENNKELCEAFIRKNHPGVVIACVKATLYYEIPETETFCNKSKRCKEGICFCGELKEPN